MNCKFCEKQCKNKNSLINHQRLCKLNPDRQLTWMQQQINLGKNGFERSDEYRERQRIAALNRPPMSEETKQKIRENSQNKTQRYRDNHSKVMREAVKRNPESYSDKNIVGRSRHFEVNGVRYNSTWEFVVAEFLTSQNIKWKRSGIKPENYQWNDKWHLYFPDFLLEEYDCYIEVKGYETERDRAKWSQSSKTVIVIRQEQINQIKKGSFILEVKSKSGDHQLITD